MEDLEHRLKAWLRSRTFHHSRFADIEALARRKRELGLRISVVIPTLNEAERVGRVVQTLVEHLTGPRGLIDELLVVDSASQDDTAEVARRAGAEVRLASEILPELGARKGKGENLWKAVHQLTGDIICTIDADIANIHPRFVYGLVGPLLEDPTIGYVKGYYERPMAHGGGLVPFAGGRVTEILVRPLLALFYPELSGVVQPLSGEYAARRSVLERLSFPVGYGVETAHLIDVMRHHGMGAIAQTDLEERVHRHQSNASLGKMSFGILQAVLRRLEGEGRLPGSGEFPEVYRWFEGGGLLPELHSATLREEERPALISVAQYRERHPGQAGFRSAAPAEGREDPEASKASPAHEGTGS